MCDQGSLFSQGPYRIFDAVELYSNSPSPARVARSPPRPLNKERRYFDYRKVDLSPPRRLSPAPLSEQIVALQRTAVQKGRGLEALPEISPRPTRYRAVCAAELRWRAPGSGQE